MNFGRKEPQSSKVPMEKLCDAVSPTLHPQSILEGLIRESVGLSLRQNELMKQLSLLGEERERLDLEIYWWKGHPDAEAHVKKALARFTI